MGGDNTLYSIGTKTRFGIIKGVMKQSSNIERYYFIVDGDKSVSYMPQSCIKGLLI